MDNEPTREEDLVQGLRDIIANSPEAIIDEYTQDYKGAPSNPWFACFSSRTAAIAGRLGRIEDMSQMPAEELAEVRGKLRALIEKKRQAIKEYGWDPPEEVRNQFLNALKNIY